MANAAYTAQFISWSSQDLLALDVPLNRAFRRLLQLPPMHPNAPLYMRTSDGGLRLPRLSDQDNLSEMVYCLQITGTRGSSRPRGSRTALPSLGGFWWSIPPPTQEDFIGPYTATPVWGSSLGALGPDTSLRLSTTLEPVPHPLLPPLTHGLVRLDEHKLLLSLRRLNLSTWADLTTRASDGTRT